MASGSSAKLEVVKYAEDDFSFNWTKEGSRRQIETASILTFQSVCAEDFSYYCCEVKEAERVVLTAYRALYRDESQTSCADPSQSGKCLLVVINATYLLPLYISPGGNRISILGKRSQNSVDIKYDAKKPKSGIMHIQLT